MATTHAEIAKLCFDMKELPQAQRGAMFLLSHLLDAIRDHMGWPPAAFTVVKRADGTWFDSLGPGGKCSLVLKAGGLELATSAVLKPQRTDGEWTLEIFQVQHAFRAYVASSEAQLAEQAAQSIKNAFVNAAMVK